LIPGLSENRGLEDSSYKRSTPPLLNLREASEDRFNSGPGARPDPGATVRVVVGGGHSDQATRRTRKGRFQYYIDKDNQLDSSLVLMVSNLLPLCENHDRITLFINRYSTFDHGVIFQAFANGVKTIRRDYIVHINSLDEEFQKGTSLCKDCGMRRNDPPRVFTWSQQVLEYLCKTLKEIEESDSDCLLTILYRHLLTATDSEIHQLIYYLIQQSIFPFLEMLGKWIYYALSTTSSTSS
jgi:hypothetical protein